MNSHEDTAPPGIHLSPKEFAEALALIQGADSVELKLTVPETDQRSVVEALEMDPLDAQIRQVYFFDTPDLALNRSGVVVRARRAQGRAHDSVVKLRPVVPGELPSHLRASPNVTVEVDAMPGGYVCSASLRSTVGPTRVREAAAGTRPVRKLFSKAQRAFFTTRSPEGIGLDDLSVLGPINVFKLKFAPKGYRGKLVAELWNYPDASRILELSTKCPPKKAVGVALSTRAFLEERGIDLSGEQQTKTKTALEFFATAPR